MVKTSIDDTYNFIHVLCLLLIQTDTTQYYSLAVGQPRMAPICPTAYLTNAT